MIGKLKQAFSDVLYVSKVTQTSKKKIIIIISVILSQVIAFADILIILLFTNLFTGSSILPSALVVFESILEWRLLLPVTIVIRYYLQYAQSLVLKKLEFSVQSNLKIYLLREIFNKKNFSTSDTFFYVNTLAHHISFFYTSIASFLNFTLQTFAFTAYLFLTEPSTISAFLVGIIFLLYPIYLLIVKSRKYEHHIYEKGKEANSDIQRVVENAFIIKLLKKEKDEIERYTSITTGLYEDLIIKHKLSILNSYLPPFVTVLLISIIAIFFSGYFTITLSFMGVTLRMFQSLASVSNSVNMVVNSQIHLDTFYKMELFKKNSIKENYIVETEHTSKNHIEVKSVNFKYLNSDEEIFTDLNLVIQKNLHTVITGPNGSGKSTLLGILAGVYFPSSGQVIGRSNKLGFVGPNPLIFSGTLKENLMYGNDKIVTDDEILQKLQDFNLFSETSETKLDRRISNKDLSSGQMQKIAFIRFLLSDADTLFLDESTSNLDTETKNLIFDILKKKKLTIVNSTHDIDSFKTIDKHYRIELNDGKRNIIEMF